MFSASRMVETMRDTGVDSLSPTWSRVSSDVYVEMGHGRVSHDYLLFRNRCSSGNRIQTDFVGFDMSSPQKTEALGGLEHPLTVDLELGDIEDNRWRADLGQRLADELPSQRVLEA